MLAYFPFDFRGIPSRLYVRENSAQNKIIFFRVLCIIQRRLNAQHLNWNACAFCVETKCSHERARDEMNLFTRFTFDDSRRRVAGNFSPFSVSFNAKVVALFGETSFARSTFRFILHNLSAMITTTYTSRQFRRCSFSCRLTILTVVCAFSIPWISLKQCLWKQAPHFTCICILQILICTDNKNWVGRIKS